MEKALLKNVYIHINSILLNQYWIIIILLIKMVKSKNVILIVNIVVLKKFIKKDFNRRILYLESGLVVKVKIKRYSWRYSH